MDSVRRRLQELDGAGSVSAIPPVRPDLLLSEGYHLPQVEAEVRLNTNESPLAPPAAWREELLAALEDVSFHRYPDRPATELRESVAALHGVTAAEVFCANGSNEVLQSLLLGLRRPRACLLSLFEPTYALHSHIARSPASQVVEGGRDDDFQIDLNDAYRLARRLESGHHVLVLAEQSERVGRNHRRRSPQCVVPRPDS